MSLPLLPLPLPSFSSLLSPLSSLLSLLSSLLSFAPPPLSLLATPLSSPLSSSPRAHELNPNHGATLNHLGTALSKIGRRSDAIPLFRRALSLEPGEVDASCNLASALANAGEEVEAEQVLMDARPRSKVERQLVDLWMESIGNEI